MVVDGFGRAQLTMGNGTLGKAVLGLSDHNKPERTIQ